MTAISWSCWGKWHNYCHSWNIDCVITDWLTYLLRLRTSSLHRLALFDTIIQNISFYDVTWAKHTMALLTWIHRVFIFLSYKLFVLYDNCISNSFCSRMQQIISTILHTTTNSVPTHWKYINYQNNTCLIYEYCICQSRQC